MGSEEFKRNEKTALLTTQVQQNSYSLFLFSMLCVFILIDRGLYYILKQDKTQNYNKLPRLVKIILYYEVPQNALCSLCLHCLNSGSKKPPGDLLSAAESQTS